MRINIKHIATFRRLECNIWRQYLGARRGERPGGRGMSRCEENLPISELKMSNFDQNRTFHFLDAMRPGRQWMTWPKTIVAINIHQHFGRSCTANMSICCQHLGPISPTCNINISAVRNQFLCQSLPPGRTHARRGAHAAPERAVGGRRAVPRAEAHVAALSPSSARLITAQQTPPVS